MSGSNPLASSQQPSQSMPSGGNPLAAAPSPGPGAPAAGAPSAQMPDIDPNKIDDDLEYAAYALPVLSKLAAKKDVSRKDIIMAISDAVAHKKIPIDDAMKALSKIPEQASQLKPWLEEKVEHINRGAIHLSSMKAMGNAIHQAHQMTVQQMQAAGMPHDPTPPPGAIAPTPAPPGGAK